MFVVKKIIKGREYLYLYKSVWRNGRSRNIFIRYIGPAGEYTDSEIRKIVRGEEESGSDEAAPRGR